MVLTANTIKKGNGVVKINAPKLKNFSQLRVGAENLKNIDAQGTDSFVNGINTAVNDISSAKDIRESRGKLNISSTQKQKMKGKTPLVDSAESSMKKSFNVPMMLKRGCSASEDGFHRQTSSIEKGSCGCKCKAS